MGSPLIVKGGRLREERLDLKMRILISYTGEGDEPAIVSQSAGEPDAVPS